MNCSFNPVFALNLDRKLIVSLEALPEASSVNVGWKYNNLGNLPKILIFEKIHYSSVFGIVFSSIFNCLVQNIKKISYLRKRTPKVHQKCKNVLKNAFLNEVDKN